ncbi:MAG TPA: transcriptional regulator [Cyanobacteria bacterium UBA8530]|nr:transcriptional regulator [Cyanobacteria bacterium UBA8530]
MLPEERPCCCRRSPEVEFPPLAEKALIFKALGDEVRLKVLHLVRDREVCVCDLLAVLRMPQGTLSHHLMVLHQAGLVSARKQGRWNYYQATALARGPLTIFEG